MRKEFLMAFRISRMIIFEVEYYTLGSNQKPHFSTTANKFTRNKLAWSVGGQAQENLLPKNSKAYSFYRKWDCKHLQDLTEKEYNELIEDIEELKKEYLYIIRELKETDKPYNPRISFYRLKELSMRI